MNPQQKRPLPPTWDDCHTCGDPLPAPSTDGICAFCVELDARLDAQIAAAMEHYAADAIGIALDYLHIDDVEIIIRRTLADPHRENYRIPRLRDRYRLASKFIDARREPATERESATREHRDADAHDSATP